MFGTFYIVATPIGNLVDITLRAIKTLSDVDIIYSEDTRVTKRLTTYYKILTPIKNYHQHSKDTKRFEILRHLIEGKNVALVTDAGTPGISDPGNELTDFLLTKEQKINVVPIPGASAITSALSVSGFKASKFIFLGYFPRKKKGRFVKIVRSAKLTVVFFESPHRILKTLKYLKKELGGNTRILVGRELTKMHETLYRGSLGEVIKRLSDKAIKGEVVVVIEYLG
jgi:16S rRNA (cytidine1402-2'-O)-methyltransferase